MPEQTELPLAADLLHGVRAIAEFIGVDERQAHWQNSPKTHSGREVGQTHCRVEAPIARALDAEANRARASQQTRRLKRNAASVRKRRF